MPIDFICEQCGRKMRAPDGTGGRKARCPMCGQTQLIPGERPAPAIELDPPPPAPQMPQPTTPYQHGATARQGATVPDSLAGECLGAVGYGLSNFKSVTTLALYAALVHVGFQLVAGFIPCVGYILSLVGNYVVMGLMFRYYLNAVISSLEGIDEAPEVPGFDIGLLFRTGMKAVGVLFVYVLPIVTLPLLPVALLAMGYSEDLRGFDVGWALRAASKAKGQLLILWLFLLFWGALGIAAVVLIILLAFMVTGALTATGCAGLILSLGIGLVAVVLVMSANVMFATIQFRCIGLLGRRNQELTDSLPDEISPLKLFGYIAGGVCVSVAMVALTIGPTLVAFLQTLSEGSEI